MEVLLPLRRHGVVGGPKWPGLTIRDGINGVRNNTVSYILGGRVRECDWP